MEQRPQLSVLEERLVELAAVEQSRVFERTRLPVGVLAAARRARWNGLRRWALVGLPAAACLALAIGLTSHVLGPGYTPLAGSGAGPDASFYACLTGPGVSATGGCSRYDRDADGDVDLRDLSEYQLACARSPK